MPKHESKHQHNQSHRSDRPHATSRSDTRNRAAALPAQPVHEFDRLIHERMRLGILSALAVNESLTFNDLKGVLSTTDGNLSVHARKLEEAKYVECNKFFEGRVPRTEYRLTRNGREALERYLDEMETLIESMRKR